MRWFVLFVGSLISPLANASTPFIDQWYNQPQSFTLELQQQQQTLTPEFELRSQILQAELTHLESRHLHMALVASKHFEQLQGSQDRDLDGYQAGLVIRAISPSWRQLQAAASTSYRRHESKRNSDSLKRHYWQLKLALQWRPNQQLGLYGGIGGWQQQGTLLLADQSYTLPNNDQPFQFIGLDLQIEPGGHIGLELQSDTLQGLALYFQRRY